MTVNSKWARAALIIVAIAGVFAVFGVAVTLSYTHIIEFAEHIGMPHNEAVLMPWSVDGLMLSTSVLVILMAAHMPGVAMFCAVTGRYIGMVATFGANVSSANFTGAHGLLLTQKIVGYSMAPVAMLLLAEVILHTLGSGKTATPAKRSANAKRAAQTRKAKAATAPTQPKVATVPTARAKATAAVAAAEDDNDVLQSALAGKGIVDLSSRRNSKVSAN